MTPDIIIQTGALTCAGVRVTDYVRHIVTHGNRPGVLSGGELRGKARKYGHTYRQTRQRVTRALERHGIRSGIALVDSRWSRVWIDADGQPITVDLITD